MRNTIITITLGILCYVVECAYVQRNKCGIEKFQCENGQCIPSEFLCDGRADCKDGSDETFSECSKPEIMCPDYAFRCAYGACVDGDKTCNGVKDCIDNSDETLPKCGDSHNESVSCAKSQFKCNNGQCIANSGLCDGTTHCADKSDETFLQCGSLNCPPLAFRCNYGACIDGDLVCNREIDCADGSDEDPNQCDRTITTVKPVLPDVTSVTTYTPPTPVPRPRQQCIVPPQPQNGYWKLSKSQCPNGQECNVEQGLYLDQGAHLIYGCNRGFKLEGSPNVLCSSDGRWFTIPTCTEISCRELDTVSVEAFCIYDGLDRLCRSPILPHTRVKLRCRDGYTMVKNLQFGKNVEVTCNENGDWVPEPIQCAPACGKVVNASAVRPLIVHGTVANVTEFPWHATLYIEKPPNNEKLFICGATIIKENLLVTAAHCVYDDNIRGIDSRLKYHVLTGNIFRDFDYPHDLRIVKHAEVKNIYIDRSYNGLAGSYAADIAILELKRPFVFSSLLVPICLDFNAYGDDVVLTSVSGKVPGFGRTAEADSSFILQSITVPFVSYDRCRTMTTQHGTQSYLTLDKFCAGYINGSAVCDGDSGGGLVFETGELWYLRGIVSLSVGTQEKGGTRICDNNAPTLYTRVSQYISWIESVKRSLDICKSYPCSSNIGNRHNKVE